VLKAFVAPDAERIMHFRIWRRRTSDVLDDVAAMSSRSLAPPSVLEFPQPQIEADAKEKTGPQFRKILQKS